MTLKTLMSIKAVICLLFGIGFLLIPSTLASYFGMFPDISGRLMAQFFGQAFVLLGLLLWLARNTSEPGIRKAFALALFVGDMIGFVVSLMAVLNGIMNALGWLPVGLYLVIGLGFGYILISKPKPA